MSKSRLERAAIIATMRQRISDEKEKFSAYRFAKEVGLTSQSIYRYLRSMENDGQLTRVKSGRKNVYMLETHEEGFTAKLSGLSEDIVWRKNCAPFFAEVPEPARECLRFSFMEMLNNAIDHSEGETAEIQLYRDGCQARVTIRDDGVGIFRKIAEAMGLEDESFAVLELTKGHFTTDPAGHIGTSISISGRMVDELIIASDGLVYANTPIADGSCPDLAGKAEKGTTVLMAVRYDHKTDEKSIDRDSSMREHVSEMVIPVRLLEYGEENLVLISRSQAKRLMARAELFDSIILDFSGVKAIGLGFADELFRVFPARYPNTRLYPINCNDEVSSMIAKI